MTAQLNGGPARLCPRCGGYSAGKIIANNMVRTREWTDSAGRVRTDIEVKTGKKTWRTVATWDCPRNRMGPKSAVACISQAIRRGIWRDRVRHGRDQ